MKHIMQLLSFILFAGFVFASCKEPLDDLQKQTQPSANAGIDQTIALPTDSIVLKGSGKDPDGIIVSYSWKKIFGPSSYKIENPNIAEAKIKELVNGVYWFQLEVTDNDGIISLDDMQLTVYADCKTPYDLDISLISTYNLIEKYNNPWDYNMPDPHGYYNLTIIEGTGIFQPFGEFEILVYQYADTAALSDSIHYNFLRIYKSQQLFVFGNCSVNFKKIIRDGGGSFNGISTLVAGSAAQQCNPNAIASLPPLTVSGSLDVITHKVTLRIQGKVYF